MAVVAAASSMGIKRRKVVAKTGNEINPHIPSYVSSAPWKGACDNCGAMTHNVKECTDRPRKFRAIWTNKNIAPDEKIERFELDYDGKRDRWNGYDAALYVHVVERYEARDEARNKYLKDQQIKKLEEQNTNKQNVGGGVDDDHEEIEDEYSSHYDPKTRSMREDPLPDMDPNDKFYINDHTTVWGSWRNNHQWGYRCCKQLIRNTYCTGAAGIAAADQAGAI
ncbi:hypothetical protein POM88_009966 [Heracleum sosnowskyi]|uniref:Pre-mRNA-splicing factor SLU7 n=1 Tax=Heracleum sosnowskyi TaxID=360622 RepID=A0AAD8JA42_9APIA|nr:hypothetical protein POM88_009966 [Heracleum sosnowskyi]